ADDVEPEETGAEDDAVERTIEIDDETMTAIARQVVDMLGEKQLATVNGALEKLTGTVEKLAGSVQTLTKQQRTIGERLEALETDEDEKRREWVSDLPNRQKPAIKVTHRPRVERQVEEAEQDYAAIAEATLAALPDPLRPR
ncbi:MAG: hypothetical protein KC546_19390, partial [Anaerolineae bacterium]|nr:hypothetical protein [Anaerolineae bacterium]